MWRWLGAILSILIKTEPDSDFQGVAVAEDPGAGVSDAEGVGEGLAAVGGAPGLPHAARRAAPERTAAARASRATVLPRLVPRSLRWARIGPHRLILGPAPAPQPVCEVTTGAVDRRRVRYLW